MDNLEFKVEEWTKGYGQIIDVHSANLSLLPAKAAYKDMVERNPDRYFMLRVRSRVIAQSHVA